MRSRDAIAFAATILLLACSSESGDPILLDEPVAAVAATPDARPLPDARPPSAPDAAPDATPAPDATKNDQRFLLGVGWAF